MTGAPVNECGKPPRKLTVIVTDGAGHYIGDGEVTIKAPCRKCDPRNPATVGEIVVQVNHDCGCSDMIGVYTREPQ